MHAGIIPEAVLLFGNGNNEISAGAVYPLRFSLFRNIKYQNFLFSLTKIYAIINNV